MTLTESRRSVQGGRGAIVRKYTRELLIGKYVRYGPIERSNGPRGG